MSRLLEKLMLIVGLACLGFYGLAAADSAYREQEARALVEQVVDRDVPVRADTDKSADVPSGAATRDEVVAVPMADHIPPKESAAVPAIREPRELTFAANVVGLLEIPRLGFSTPVLEGDDARTLRGAAGHLSDTPRPGEPGNSAIAAHRDGIFRPLRNIRVGDELRVQTSEGELRYRVSDTHIVRPSDLSVLEAKTPQMLTLITCYPFNYIGAAPKRFIVHADRILP